jgi:hypothetical protein
MDEVKQRVKDLWQFSTDKEPSPYKDTEEYNAGVKDALYRVEYLWMCYKMGAGDKEDWVAMDTLSEATAIVELILEE